jgi:hypothetical protein
VIDRLSADLRREFPEMTGLSRTNLKYMRSLAEAYSGDEIGQQAVGQIPWEVGPFEPEYAGKMNFYLAAVDDQLRREGDQPSIGLILCKERNRVVVEYALRGTNQPMGVAAYRLTETLPQTLRGSLPSPEELERELREDGAVDERW